MKAFIVEEKDVKVTLKEDPNNDGVVYVSLGGVECIQIGGSASEIHLLEAARDYKVESVNGDVEF